MVRVHCFLIQVTANITGKCVLTPIYNLLEVIIPRDAKVVDPSPAQRLEQQIAARA